MLPFFITTFLFFVFAILFLTKPTWLVRKMPWIWKNLGNPIFQYFFVTTVRKVTITYLYVLAGVTYTPPLLKLCIKVVQGTENDDIVVELGWNNDWIDYTSITIAILATVGFVCFITYEKRKLREPSVEVLDAIKDSDKRVNEKLNCALKRITNSDVTNALIPQLQDAITNLHVKTANGILEELRKLVLAEKFVDYRLLMQIDYNIGRCLRYVDEKQAIKAFHNAYKWMEEVQKFDASIAESEIFCLCKENNYEATKKITDRLVLQDCESIWVIIPQILSAEDALGKYKSFLKDKQENQSLLANLMILDPKHFNTSIIDIDNYPIPRNEKLSIDNFPLWMLSLSVLQTRFLNIWTIAPEIKNREETDTSKDLYDEINRYLKFHAKTEIGNVFPDAEFIRTWVSYIHDHSPAWLDAMRECKYSKENKDLYFIAYASMLITEKRISEAVEFLGTYGEPTSKNVLGYRLEFAIWLQDNEIIREIFTILVKQEAIIEGNLFIYVLTSIQYFNEQIVDFVSNLQFAECETKHFVQEIALFFAGKDIDIEYIKKHSTDVPEILKPYVALIYEKYVGLEEAIALIEQTIDYRYFDLRSSIYFKLLNKDKRYGTKLYDFCESVRVAGNENRETLLCELRLAEQLEDNERALTITTMMMNNAKQTGLFVEHYLMALFHTNNTDKIRDFYPHLIDYTYDNINSVSNIFNIYLVIGMTEEALDFLYIQTKGSMSQELRDLFYQASVKKNIGEIIHKQYDCVEIGSYVLLDIDGKEEYVEVLSGSQYDVLLNKSVGNNVTIKLFNRIQQIQIKAIFNKYHHLYVDILREIHNNQSKTIRSFSIDDLQKGDGFIANLSKISGGDEEYRKLWNESIANYQNGSTTLYSFVNESPFIADLYNKLFGTFVVCSMPRNIVRAKIREANVDVNTLQPVLDVSGLLLIHELCLKFSISIEKKFILPKSIETAVLSAYNSETIGMPSLLDSEASEKLTIIQTEQELNYTPLACKLKMLINWIKDNCIIELNREILNHDVSEFDGYAQRMFMDAAMLTLNQQRVLITEDWVLSFSPYDSLCSMSASNWLSFVQPQISTIVDEYIFNLHYLGCEITSGMLCKLMNDSERGKRTLLPVVMENIERFNHVSAVVEAAITITESFITPYSTSYALNLFVSMFHNMEYADAKRLKMLIINKYGNGHFKQIVEDAYKITHPLIVF